MNASETTTSMMTINDVSSFLNVQVNTVQRWGTRGILRSYPLGNQGERIFEKKDIDKFLIDLRTLIGENKRVTYLQGLLIHR